MTLVVLGELTQTVGLENLLDEVGVFVGRLDELLHVLALMIELVSHVYFLIRSVDCWLDKDSLLFKHYFIHDGRIWVAN